LISEQGDSSSDEHFSICHADSFTAVPDSANVGADEAHLELTLPENLELAQNLELPEAIPSDKVQAPHQDNEGSEGTGTRCKLLIKTMRAVRVRLIGACGTLTEAAPSMPDVPGSPGVPGVPGAPGSLGVPVKPSAKPPPITQSPKRSRSFNLEEEEEASPCRIRRGNACMDLAAHLEMTIQSSAICSCKACEKLHREYF
jgi:hypothetical protein